MAVGASAALIGLPAASAGAAQLQSFGDPLTDPANASFGCETVPRIGDTSGNYLAFASGQPDCTWFNTAGGTVPGDGRIRTVSVRSGPRPARLRFVVVRTLGSPGAGTVCCFFAGESAEFRPAPNAVQTFPVNLAVERNTNPKTGIVTADTVGVSAVSGAGTLPVHDSGRHNLFDPIDPGNSASFFYPRFGAVPNDSGGGRHADGAGGWRVLIRVGFCPDGQTCGAATGVPVITRPALVPNVFRVAPGATPVTARARRGATLSFTLSQAGTAKIAIQRRSSRSRWRTVGTLNRKGLKPGKRSIRFTGRIGTKALSPGSYRVAITAKNASRGVSKVATAGFRIVR
jgi:hypothetical protein